MSIPTNSRRWTGRRSATTARRNPSAHHASRQSARAADAREDEALGEQLAHEPRASGAERGADRELAVARGRPREQEVGDVGAGNEEHEGDGAGEDEQRGTDVAGQLLAQRHDA